MTTSYTLTPKGQAETDIINAKQAVQRAEVALFEAQEALRLAEGRLWLVLEQPTWRHILTPGVEIELHDLYKYCMQLGFSYALWEGKIYKAGKPGEGMIFTGAKEADIP